ncbi:Ubiquitin carboxyl-terminal hydrolase 26, partial [Mortierella alpina]
MTSDNTESRLLPPADDQPSRCSFNSSVHVVNLQRASLSRKFDKAQCLLARDASVNLYVDHRKELDFITFRLTHGIRQVYINKKVCSVKIHLSNQQRLDVTLDSEDLCQSFYDQVARVKEKPNSSETFPRHQPKIGIEQKPDPNSAYLTAKDTPTGLARPSALATVPIVPPSTPVKRKMAIQRPAMVLEQTHKRACKDQPTVDSFSIYRQSGESRGSLLSDSPVSSEPTPDRWRFPSSPIYLDDEAMTPSKSTSITQAIGQFEKFGRVDSLPITPLQRPQFHAIVPTPRVLRSMRSTTKRYGCEVESRKSKNALLQDRSSGSKCIAAVLQALFCLDSVSKLLQEPSAWIRLSGSQHGIFRSLADSYAHHVKSNTLAVEDEVISHSVTKTAKGSLGDDQDDAREFLKDCLGQLRHEFQGRSVDAGCPMSEMFDCQVEDIVVCASCGNQTIRTEHYQDFCLELPMVDNNRSTQRTMSLGSLVPQVFDTRQTSLVCEICLAETATVHRAISKLPTVLVLYLKRFSSKPTQGYNKNRSLVGIDETLEF